jgi:hypothetical protein
MYKRHKSLKDFFPTMHKETMIIINDRAIPQNLRTIINLKMLTILKKLYISIPGIIILSFSSSFPSIFSRAKNPLWTVAK